MRHSLRRTLFILIVVAGACLGFRHVRKARFAASRKPASDGTPADVGLDPREIRFESTDGLDLEAWWIPNEGSSRVAVLAHGRKSSKSSPYVIEAASIYSGAGFNVLALDLRSRGGSEGRFLTGGYQEARDVRGALRWLGGRGFETKNVVLHGWSTGAVAVLRAAPGTGVGAVVEESAYADLPLLLGDFLPGPGGPSYLLSRMTSLVAGLLGVEFDPWALRPRVDAARLSEEGVPLFVVHSPDDGVIPFGHAGLLMAAHPGADFWEVEHCGHAAAYAHPEYPRKLLGFLNEAMGVHDGEAR